MKANFVSRGYVSVALMTALVTGASAQNWSSFWQAETISGVSMSYNVVTKELTASMSPGAKVKIAGVEREIENFFGFYVLHATGGGGQGPLGATNDTSPTGWNFWDDNQYLAGWSDNNKTNLGSPKTGKFATLAFPSNNWWGMHVTYKGTNGMTQYIRWNGGTPPSNVVPEPFTMGLGIAAAGAFVRRRVKAKKN
jgi:hypothetical protein